MIMLTAYHILEDAIPFSKMIRCRSVCKLVAIHLRANIRMAGAFLLHLGKPNLQS